MLHDLLHTSRIRNKFHIYPYSYLSNIIIRANLKKTIKRLFMTRKRQALFNLQEK